ncbi:MAG: type II secretion system F family protein [Planctomycetota bacterium]|nr:type II secretion system F family protein [Planctomycetota bacterium]
MIRYRYTAEGPNGERVDGHVDAASVADARRRLADEGLRVLEIIASGGPADEIPAEALSVEEARELVGSVAQWSAAGLPLAAGLRAAGQESGSPKLARAFDWLADQLERGRPLEEVLDASAGVRPVHVNGLVRAALLTGQLGPALTELVEHHRDAASLRQSIRDGLAYPLLVLGMATVILALVIVFVAGGFEEIYDEFAVQLPAVTVVFFGFRRAAGWLLPLVAALALILGTLLRWRLGRAGWHRLLSSAPVLGPICHWLGLLEWIGLLQVLVRNGMTLFDALRLSAGGTSNANVGQIARALAEGVGRGRSLSQAIASQRQLPASLVPLVRWGEQAGGLVESLAMGCEMLEDRIRMRSLWLHAALPPLLFLSIGCVVLLVVGALFFPLIHLVSSLS